MTREPRKSEEHQRSAHTRNRVTGAVAAGTACLTLITLIATGTGAAAEESISPTSADPVATPGAAVLRPMATKWGDDTTGEGKKARAEGVWRANHDEGSAFTVAKQIGAQKVWRINDPLDRSRNLTGHGVGVALIDTGISPVEGLLTPGKVVNGPDLSFDSQAPNLTTLDGYGHGTHMAGLIAGRDSTVLPGHEDNVRHFVGMAPDAKVVNVKVGAADGAVDVSQVIAGIDWVVANKARHNIRVLNLSYGTESVQASQVDPLAHAVQSAWRAGIVVVVAAGNDGEDGPSRLTMPAIDPFVIAVGSSNHQGGKNRLDYRFGAWTNSGTAERRPDLLAPGKSLVSLRTPGSIADTLHPEGLVKGAVGKRMFRGTGTSQSAAVVSGAVALLMQRNPELTPDQVKGLLKATADSLRGDSNPSQGGGQLDIDGAVKALAKGNVPAYTQTFPASTGLGSLEASRGGSFVVDPVTSEELRGERDIFGVAWDPATWSTDSRAATAWTGGMWRGTAWSGARWAGDDWAAANWTRRAWTGTDWTRRAWTADDFLRRAWTEDDWSRRAWTRRAWTSLDASDRR